MRRFKGFTLIELLIVVLIIAILAAIAVPNFLEFQTRAKVSRALADMRSIRTGVEAYCVDDGSYPQSTCPLNNSHSGDEYFSSYPGAGGIVQPETTWHWLRKLTTPISYMSTIPPDPFSEIESPSWYGGVGRNPFHFYSGNGKQYASNATYTNLPRMMYLMFSIGPDNKINVMIDNTDADAYILYNRAVHNGGGRGWDSPNNGLFEARPYDPTNGTTSTGDIYSFSTTDSSVWDYFLY